MPEFNFGYGPTEAEFTKFTNRTVTNSAEFERQRQRSCEVWDAAVGLWTPFHPEQTVEFSTVGADTFTSSSMTVSLDDYYNNLELRVVQGTGKGYRGFITSYTASTGAVTVSGVSDAVAFSAAIPGDTAVLTQIAQFPREIDIDISGRPHIPSQIPQLISYIIEYYVNLESQQGFNSDELANISSDIIQEGLGAWQTTYKTNRDSLIQLIGPKAFEMGTRLGFFKRTAQLRRYRRSNF